MLTRYRAWGADFIFDAYVSHTPMRAHIAMPAVLFMPEEVLCRRFAAPLWHCTFSCRSGPTYFEGSAFLHTKVYPANVAPHTHAHGPALPGFLLCPIRRRFAPRKMPAKPESSFPLRPCEARRRKSACGHFIPHGREYGSPLRLRPAPKPGNSSGAAFQSVPPFRSGAPRQSTGIAPGH